MKLLQEKWLAGVLSLAFVASCVGGCAQPTGTPAGGSSTGASTSSAPAETEASSEENGANVPQPEDAGDEGEAKTE